MTEPSTGANTSVPGAVPTSRTFVPGGPPSSWYQRGDSRRAPTMLRHRRASSPSLACRPTGWSDSEPSLAPWNPIAVSAGVATGSWMLRLPTVASTCGLRADGGSVCGHDGLERRGAAGGSARPEGGEEQRDNAERAEHRDAARVRRARRWARRLRSRRRAACRERGEAIAAR